MDGSRPARAHFIPFRKRDVLAMCLAEGALAEGEAEAFSQCAAMAASLIHQEFHVRLEALKDAYAPVAADSDTRPMPALGAARPPQHPLDLVRALTAVLERANYETVSRLELHGALSEESLFRVRLHVNYDDFDEVLVFKRGETERTETVRRWFRLRKRKITFVNYDRVLVYVRFKDAAHFRRRRRRRLPFVPGTGFIKLFQNIPKADVEMLFPNAEVRCEKCSTQAKTSCSSRSTVAVHNSQNRFFLGDLDGKTSAASCNSSPPRSRWRSTMWSRPARS